MLNISCSCLFRLRQYQKLVGSRVPNERCHAAPRRQRTLSDSQGP
eukprot:UN3330